MKTKCLETSPIAPKEKVPRILHLEKLSQANLNRQNPFQELHPIYQQAAEESQAMTPQERLKDWELKCQQRLVSGTSLLSKPLIIVSPATGQSVQI